MTTAKGSAMAIGGAPQVNLMPRSETERRRTSALVRRWITALIGALALVAAATAGAFWLQLTAVQGLVAENARTQGLLSQLAELSDVQSQLDLQSELTTFRGDAMATELRWGALVGTVGSVLPEGVTITGFSLAPAGMPRGDDPAAEVGATGSVTLASAGPQQVVPLVRAVRGLPGVIEADGWAVDATDTGFTYELRIAFDQSVYAGAHDEEAD